VKVPEALALDLRKLANQRRVGVASVARWLLSSGLERELVSHGEVDVQRELVGAGR
jgi:hypothetical protein